MQIRAEPRLLIAMETQICQAKTHNVFCSSRSPLKETKTHQNSSPRLPSLSFKVREKPNHGLVVARPRCAKWGSASVAGLVRELEAEMKSGGEDGWIKEMGNLREKCKERKGVVELLECLEREAIMGEDEGRDPVDYNRRAQIFDKSSKVFAALKERTTIPSHQGQS